MDFTTLPTDNLYKFLALTGVLIAALSVFVPYTLIGDAIREQTEIYGGQEIAQIELKYIEDELKEALEKNKGELPSEERLRLRKELRDAKIEGEKAITRFNHFSYLRQRALDIRRHALIGFWFGVALASTGFVLWYTRLQRYQDIILRKQTTVEETNT